MCIYHEVFYIPFPTMVGHLILMESSGMLRQSLLMHVSVYNVTQTISVHN